jgi:hypothetical protein
LDIGVDTRTIDGEELAGRGIGGLSRFLTRIGPLVHKDRAAAQGEGRKDQASCQFA